MKQQNQGKITVQQGEKNGDELIWSDILGEKEFLYYGEAKEELESITWRDAEAICNRKLEDSHAILIKAWNRTDMNWTFTEERILLWFAAEERLKHDL